MYTSQGAACYLAIHQCFMLATEAISYQINVYLCLCVFLQVEPYSIAGQDGRIREGDQILQVNIYVHVLIHKIPYIQLGSGSRLQWVSDQRYGIIKSIYKTTVIQWLEALMVTIGGCQ